MGRRSWNAIFSVQLPGPGLAADFGASLRRQGGGKIAFTRGAGDGDDRLALVFGTLRDFDRSPDIGAGGNPDQNAFLLGETTSHRKRVVVRDLDAFGDLRRTRRILEVKIEGD